MLRTSRTAVYCVVLAATLLSAPAFASKKMKELVPPAPAPSQLVTGRKVFLSYAGINTMSLAGYIVDAIGSPNGLYDEFYAAIKNWDGYQLVSAPASSDLVFEIGIRQVRGEDPHFVLNVVDPRTNVLLWTFNENVNGGNTQASRRQGWDGSLASLVNQVRQLAGESPAEPTK